ncbi:MAG: hypothetical protein HQ517_15700 [SAR324 cluster bacterium]|nr:hypothetical protein [SAR324 cluster bacterium]
MELYYDAFVYISNWGTRELMLKIPRKLIDWDQINQYGIGESATVYPKGESLIFEFSSQMEDYEWEQGEGWLSSLISLRSDIMQGDYRCLYLGWLYGAQNGDFDDDVLEPHVPGGLRNLNGALMSFIDFIRLDTDLVTVAAERSQSGLQIINEKGLYSWIDAIPDRDKNKIIKELMLASNPHLGNGLMQQFKKDVSCDLKQPEQSIRTVGELLFEAESYSEKQKKEAAEKRAREDAAKNRAAAIARKKYLNEMAGREESIWDHLEGLINAKKSRFYKEALRLLLDLNDLGKINNKSHIFKSKLQEIRQRHKQKTSFIKELDSAGLK